MTQGLRYPAGTSLNHERIRIIIKKNPEFH
jgi:hypothetical protein